FRDLIVFLISAEYRFKLILNQQCVPSDIEDKSNKNELHKRASRYLESKRIHTPSLAALMVVALLDNELIDNRSSEEFKSANSSLKTIRDEIASRTFDTNEVIRRLRRVEKQGCYFSSLIYPLLIQGQVSENEPETM